MFEVVLTLFSFY